MPQDLTKVQIEALVHEVLKEGWRDALQGLFKHERPHRAPDFEEPTKGEKPSPTTAPVPDSGPSPPEGAPSVPTPSAAPPAPGGTLPLSASEMRIIQQIGKNSRQSNVFQIVNREINNLGVAQKNPQVIPILKAFKAEFLQAVQNLYKRANINIAESMLYEQEKMTPQQRARLKAKLRKGAGAMAYFKPAGGRPPLLLRTLQQKLTYHLIDQVRTNELQQAIAQVIKRMKPADAKQLSKGFTSNPERRLKIYKENVHVFVEEVLRLAKVALEKAVAANVQPKRQLPETHLAELNEAQILNRWKVLSGVE